MKRKCRCKTITTAAQGVEVLLVKHINFDQSLSQLCKDFNNSQEQFWGCTFHPKLQTPPFWRHDDRFKKFVSWWNSVYTHLPAMESVSIMCTHHALSPHRDQNIVCESGGAILVVSLTGIEYQVTIHSKDRSPMISFKMKGESAAWMCLGNSRELLHSTTKSAVPKYTLRMGFRATDQNNTIWTVQDWTRVFDCVCKCGSKTKPNGLPTPCEVYTHFNRINQ